MALNLSQVINRVDVDVLERSGPSTAHPKGIIVPEYLEFANATYPHSVDANGILYGASGYVIFKSEDALVSLVNGFDFSTIKPGDETWTIRKVAKTYSGYAVVILYVKTGVGSGIKCFFSESFDSGFTQVYTYPDSFWCVNFYNGGLFEQIGLICGYTGTLNNPFGLHMTKDGGQTWSNIKNTIVNNAGFVAHWHTAEYDPWTGNIFASNGDGDDNRALWMTEDMGATWEQIATPVNTLGFTHLDQPTLLIACRDKIVMAPDGIHAPCLYSLVRDRSFNTKDGHAWTLRHELGVSDIANTAQWFANPFYASNADRSQIYAMLPQNSPMNHTFIVGSGDCGASWHIVYSANITGVTGVDFNNPLIGVDKNDYFYTYMYDGTKHYIVKFKTPGWVFN